MSQAFFYPPNLGSAAATVTANQGLPNTDANAWPVRITDGTHDALVNTSGEQLVAVSSLPLPAGSATSANQVTQIGLENNIDVSTHSLDLKTPTLGQKNMAGSSPVVIASDQSAIPVSAASLPLPSGAATSANQTSILARLTGSLVPAAYDFISLSYTGTNITTVVYKSGGSGGTTVKTLTLAYTGSQLDSVTAT